jgi:hypothetical protein
MEADVVSLQDLFLFDFKAGSDRTGRFLGSLQPTGLRPRFTDDLAVYGVTLPVDMFDESARRPPAKRAPAKAVAKKAPAAKVAPAKGVIPRGGTGRIPRPKSEGGPP